MIQKLDCPVFLVINKIDLVLRDAASASDRRLSALHSFAEVIPISAKKRDGLDLLLHKMVEYLPEGQRYFPKDQFTDQPERFLVAELIRERSCSRPEKRFPMHRRWWSSASRSRRRQRPPGHEAARPASLR